MFVRLPPCNFVARRAEYSFRRDTMPRTLILPLLALALALSASTACGGKDGRSEASPPAAVLEEIDLGQSVQSIQQLKSFRFDLAIQLDASGAGSGDPLAAAFLGALGNITANGAVVAPDQAEMHMTLFGEQFSYIQIGSRAWEKTGSSWRAASSSDLLFDLGFEDLITDFLPDQVLKNARTSREKVNGVETVRYSFDKSALEKVVGDLGEAADFSVVDGVSLDVWLNGGNIPVKMVMSVAGSGEDGAKYSMSMEMNITDINDTSIKIRPPI
jgi:hypothetical protein